MIYLSYLLSLISGCALGLLGGGGSILIIPILVYVAHVSPHLATSYSLIIVGVSSLVGALPSLTEKLFQKRAFFYFGIPSSIAVFITRKGILPLIPENFYVFQTLFSKDKITLILFTFFMILVGVKMIRKTTVNQTGEQRHTSHLIFQGILVGVITGIIGIGGGFLIVPALVNRCQIPMKSAVSTSLFIIALNSLIGILGDLSSEIVLDVAFFMPFLICSIIGIFIGQKLMHKISTDYLKQMFGIFVLILSMTILLKEFFL